MDLKLLKQKCDELGLLFSFNVNLPVEYKSYGYFEKWLDSGNDASMEWLKKKRPINEYLDYYPWAKSVLGFVYRYNSVKIPDEILNDPSRGIIARYAWDRDYHKKFGKQLKELQKLLKSEGIESVQKMDTAPILERDLFNQFDEKGFIGKNSLFIIPGLGSFHNIGLLITDYPSWENSLNESKTLDLLKPGSKCGMCTKCMDLCPTKAITSEGIIDSRLCIAYLTIEHDGEIPKEFWPMMGNRIFGCDICQEVCPYNYQSANKNDESNFIDWDKVCPKLDQLINLSEVQFKEKFKGTPVIRTGYNNFIRNVKIAIFNRDNNAR